MTFLGVGLDFFPGIVQLSKDSTQTRAIGMVLAWVLNVMKERNLYAVEFPASRGLFSVVFAELTGARKIDLPWVETDFDSTAVCCRGRCL